MLRGRNLRKSMNFDKFRGFYFVELGPNTRKFSPMWKWPFLAFPYHFRSTWFRFRRCFLWYKILHIWQLKVVVMTYTVTLDGCNSGKLWNLFDIFVQELESSYKMIYKTLLRKTSSKNAPRLKVEFIFLEWPCLFFNTIVSTEG